MKEEDKSRRYTQEQIDEITNNFIESKRLVEHLLDVRGMDEMDRANFYMNCYMSDCVKLNVSKEEFAKISELAYEIHVSLKEE